MKKLLVILMVVAMASFLFVGCVPTTPAEEEAAEEEEEEEVVVAATVAPIITAITDAANVVIVSLTSTATQYMSAAEVANGIIVHGTAPTYSEVKIYVDDVCAGTGNVGDTGIFEVVVAEADLGADATDKVIYATAKEAAIDVSAHSTEYTFVLDQVKPSATTVAATAQATAAVDSAVFSGTCPIGAAAAGGTGTLAAGIWTITCLGDSADVSNIMVSDGTTTTTYTVAPADIANLGIIPGVQFTLLGGFAAGDAGTITVTAATAGRATVLYSEPVTFATCDLGVFTAIDWDTGIPHAPTPVAKTYVAYIGSTTYYTVASAPDLALYDTLRVVVNGATDLAGNVQTTASALTCTVAAASATSLAP